MRTIAFLLLVACATRAQEPLVERLETELRGLVQRVGAAADDACVTVMQGWSSSGYVRDAAVFSFAVSRARHPYVVPANAILVGTPPRVVAPYSAVGKADRVVVHLRDGREMAATRWGGDPDLGVVVFKLPEEVAKGLKGVEVEGDWARIGAGSIAVATDGGGRGGPTLGIVAAADPRLGTIDVPGEDAAVFGSRGTLLGLRGGADATACWTCHLPAAPAALTSLAGSAVNFAFLEAESKRKEAPGTSGAGGRSFWPGSDVMYDNSFSPAQKDARNLVAGPVIRRVLDDLEQHGAIRHSYLGVVVGDGPADMAGVPITSVVPDSPAAAAGLAVGGRIVAIDDLKCPSAAFISRVLVLHRPGDEVELKVLLKEGDTVPTLFKVRLGERAAARSSFATAESIGLTCVELGGELRRFLGLPDDLRGVVVQDVAGGSPAEKAGIKRGDVITRGGGGATPDLEELNAALAGARSSIDLSGVRNSSGRDSSTSSWEATVSIPDR